MVMESRNIIRWLAPLIVIVVGMVACNAPVPNNINTEIIRIEDSIKNGNLEAAKQLIAQHMSEARDSDMYYRWLSAQNRVWYAEMNVDSMTAVNNRIYEYLSSHENKMSPLRTLLWAEWYKTKAVFFSAIQGRTDSALIYNEKAIRLLETLKGENEFRLTVMTNQAFFYRQVGKYDKSVEGYVNALEFADSIGKSEEDKTPLLLGISTVYTYMGDYERSNYWWNRCQELLPNMIQADQFIYYNDRGNDFYFQKKYDKARDCFIQAASLVKGDENKLWDYYTSLTNLGEIYVCLGKADSARIMLHQVDSFFRKVNFPPLLYYIETSAIKLEILEGRPQHALQMIRNSKLTDPQIPSARAQRLIATKQVMRETGNYREAYQASHHLHLLSDSLQRAQISMQFSTKLMAYEHDKKLIEQARIIEKTRADKILALGLLSIALFTVAILLVLILFFRRRQKYNELQTRQQIVMMRMENIRNRITPHFIYNALNHEVLAQMEGRKVDLNTLTQLLRRGVELAGIFQTTLAEEISFVDYYIDIEGRQMGPDFKYFKEIAPDVNANNVYLPSMIVQIFAENALKHGLRPLKPEKGRLRKLIIRVSREKQATLVAVMDNGNGLQGRMNTTGSQTGSRVVRQTIQMLNDSNKNKITFGIGNWEQDGESGCRSWLLLPDEYDYQLAKQDV